MNETTAIVPRETWRPVPLPQFAAAYEVSDLGHVRRLNHSLLLRASSTGGHHHLQLKLRSADGTTKNCMVSHLVMGAFGEAPDGRPVDYRDGNPRNCTLENLYFPNKPLGTGGGHSQQVLAKSLEEVTARIWKIILPETLPLLAAMPK